VVTRRSFLAAGGGAAAAVLMGCLSSRTHAGREARHDVHLTAADGRDVRVTVWPASGVRRGTILFSHGALSAPEKYERLILPWSAAGFTVMAPLHVDSTDHPEHANPAYGMLGSWRARLLDMRSLAAFAAVPYTAAGHSYGGLTALTLGGAAAEVPPGLSGPLDDPRVTSVVAFSPPGVSPGLVTLEGYRTLKVPALIETGDHDVPYNSKDGRWQGHLAAYYAAPAGDKYALVLEGVDHYFGGLICKFDAPGPPQDAQLKAAVGVSTVFIEAYGARSGTARRRLNASLSTSGPLRLARK
jgi:hypothetical protein